MKYVTGMILIGTLAFIVFALHHRAAVPQKQATAPGTPPWIPYPPPRVPPPDAEQLAQLVKQHPIPVVAPAQAAPVAPPPVAPKDDKDKPDDKKDDWVLKHEMDGVVSRASDGDFKTYYSTSGGWTAFPIQLQGTEADEAFLKLSERTPHDVRWELTFSDTNTGQKQAGWEGKMVQCSLDGFYLAPKARPEVKGIPYWKDQKLVIERSSDILRFTYNDAEVASFIVDKNDRTPLKAATDGYDMTISASRVFYKTGDAQSDPPPDAAPAIGRAEPKWEPAFSDSLTDAKAAERLFVIHGNAQWFEKKQALLLDATDGDLMAVLHKSLPGDLRVRFKALRAKAADQVSIAFHFGIRGAIGHMDGYFAEWARGIAQLKRQGHVLKRVDAPTPETTDRWVNIELRRVGGQITMLMENKELLTVTERHPPLDSRHDLCGFYIWNDRTLVKDLSIDRNANDTVKPMSSDPATKENAVDGVRDSLKEDDF